ncbi:MAG: magnesium and cobalt transport protein CorA [Gemmatimonadetes bacterium]|nr:MAG: magnesium and cobalt transport protein CorA [Gemmatimonadota bacterium]
MSAALKPLQYVRPSAEPHVWSCYNDPNGRIRLDLSREEIERALASGEGTLWIDIDTRDGEKVAMLRDVFHFHPLAIEEAVSPESRVKLEEFDQYVLLIVRTVAFCETTDDPYDLDTANISFFLGKNYLVTVHGADTNPVDSTRELLQRKPELATHGPAKLMHAIVDQAVDAYFPIIDKLDEFMDSLEEKIYGTFDQGALREVFAVKRLVLTLRRHLAPERDALSVLTNRPSTLLTSDIQIYFRDIYDHVLRIYDSLETYRELLSSTLDSYLTQVSNRLGMATKALGVVATVTLPFVVVSGMWGMNFEHIPLHSHPHGFMILVLAQLALGLTILAGLKWRKLL